MSKQYYYPYTELEDWQGGMFEMPNKEREFSEAWEVNNEISESDL